MAIPLFDDDLPVAGETQIRTDGLYVSSYAKTSAGLPYLSESAAQVLSQGLNYKDLLESSPGCWLGELVCKVVANTAVPMDDVEEKVPESWLPKPKPAPAAPVAFACAACGRTMAESYAIDGKYLCESCATPIIAARYPHAPESSDSPEEDTSQDGHVRAAASCLAEEVTRSIAQPGVGNAVPALKPRNELFDVPKGAAAEPVDAFLDQNSTKNGPDSAPLSVTGSPMDPFSAVTSGARRRKSVRLTDQEREVAVRLGLRPSSISPTYSGPSVLDNYEPVRSARKRSYGPPKNLLVKAVAAQDEHCGYCDRLFGSLVLVDGKLVTLKAVPDHFMPRAKRLNNASSNIVAACQVCNRLKDSRVFASVTQARAVLQAAWRERGWNDVPLLVPFKLTMPTCFN
jgi:5-methylcytosine-specific restriction endonuclease McrA